MKVGVVNLRSPFFEHEIMQSIKNTGFVVLTHHGISSYLIQDVQSAWREFFLKPEIFKKLFVNEKDSNMGYKEMRTETAVGSNKPDLKEFFHWKPGKDNAIPEAILSNQEMLFRQLEDVGGRILTVIDKDMGNTNYRGECDSSDNTLLRTLYYPAMDFNAEPGAVRAAAHEDINHITLLVAATAPGLEVKDLNGDWHAVPHEENSIVMNVGDMLQLASGGKYKSTTHRVVNPENNTQDRISMPLFIHPHSNTILAPGITAKSYLDERIAQIYGKK